MLVRRSYQLSHWSSGIGAEDRCYISIDIAQFAGWISVGFTLHGECQSTKVPRYFFAEPRELGISSHWISNVSFSPSNDSAINTFFTVMYTVHEYMHVWHVGYDCFGKNTSTWLYSYERCWESVKQLVENQQCLFSALAIPGPPRSILYLLFAWRWIEELFCVLLQTLRGK